MTGSGSGGGGDDPAPQLGLQMGRGMQISAHFARAAAFYEVHAHGHQSVRRVHLHVIGRMGEAAVSGTALTVSPLKLPANLIRNKDHSQQWTCSGKGVTDLQPISPARRR